MESRDHFSSVSSAPSSCRKRKRRPTSINPFDLTKVWPHKDYPLVDIGELVLDRNPVNYFAEVERAALEPKSIIPGMGFSPDKMLHARLIS